MERIVKFWLFLFLIGNICAQYKVLTPFANMFFYPLLGFSVIAIFSNCSMVFSSRIISTYKFIYAYVFILWIYQFTFGLSQTHDDTWMYIIAKTAVLLMTVIAVEKNYAFYHTLFCKYFLLFCVVLIILGLTIFNHGASGRQYLGFGNPNAGGHLASICVAGLLMVNPIKNKIWLLRGMMLICLVAVMLSGSRASLGVVIIAIVMKYGLSRKLVIAAIIGFFTLTILLPMTGIQFAAVERFTQTLESRDYSSGRESERQAALLMISESPMIGNGICTPQTEQAMMISELGSHNTYLDWLKWFGIPLGGVLILFLVAATLRLFFHYRKVNDEYKRFHLFIVVSTVIICYFEGFIWGVNEMSNTLFFTSLAILDCSLLYKGNDVT